jgi:hypothetical protein
LYGTACRAFDLIVGGLPSRSSPMRRPMIQPGAGSIAASPSLARSGKGEALSEDGLEAGVCFVDASGRRLVFAGAHFSLWYCADSEVKEIRGDRPALGFSRFGSDTVFTNVPIELKRRQAFYMATDGLIGQIGGARRRPFGKRRLAQFVAEHHQRPMTDQASILGGASAIRQRGAPGRRRRAYLTPAVARGRHARQDLYRLRTAAPAKDHVLLAAA